MFSLHHCIAILLLVMLIVVSANPDGGSYSSRALHSRQSADTFELISPKLGSSFAVNGDDASIVIEWMVPAAIADKSVYISLKRGFNESSLTTIDVVNGESIYDEN